MKSTDKIKESYNEAKLKLKKSFRKIKKDVRDATGNKNKTKDTQEKLASRREQIKNVALKSRNKAKQNLKSLH